MHAIREGFRRASREPFAIGALFLFHFVWGTWLYRLIEQRVVEVMSRYPAPELGSERENLFLYDLFLMLHDKTVALPLVGMLLVFAAVRLVLVPVLDAGMYNSLHDGQTPRGTAFIRGIRRLSVSFVWLYILRLVLLAIPLYWAAPAMFRSWLSAAGPWQLAAGLAPWLLGLAVYGAVLRLLLMYVLFALAGEDRLLPALGFACRRIWHVAAIALLIFAVSLAISLLLFSASLYWAGLLSVALYLTYPLLRVWLRVWGIAAQHQYWLANRP